MRTDLQRYLLRCSHALKHIPSGELEQLASDICAAHEEARTVFLCGNGGSAANASHICQDLAKSTLPPDWRGEETLRRLRVISLTDNVSHLLACANDYGYESVFVEPLRNLAAPDDVLICLSGSGNSPNVLRATEWANANGLLTWGVTGSAGGELGRTASRSLRVATEDMGIIESLHLLLFHWIIERVRDHIEQQHPHLRDPHCSARNPLRATV